MAPSGVNERKWIWLFCCLAAVHVFVFSAAFPFFNNVDEQAHFDLVVNYSHGHVPRGLEPVTAESAAYITLYSSSAYLGNPTNYSDGRFPPPAWKQPIETVRETLQAKQTAWRTVVNYEGSQPPLYYVLAGLWWHLGKAAGCHDGFLLYWVRFLNVFFAGALVWIGFAAARLAFPGQSFVRLGVPALLAFIPQTAFYSIQNDILSPLCFGAAFICLMRLWRAEVLNVRFAAVTGLAIAATFFAKVGNLPLVAVALMAVLIKAGRLAKQGTLQPALPAFAVLLLCAGLPIGGWLVRCQYWFGDITGSAAKIAFLGWTSKPIGEWWPHPIFTPHGLWTFLSGLMATFWQGEFLWHREPLAQPAVNLVYALLSLLLAAMSLAGLFPRLAGPARPERGVLWLGGASVIASIVFLGWLSIFFDFHDCFYPSRAHPYFTSGRLMLGALIPFLLLFVYGLDRALGFTRSQWPRTGVLAGMILFMLISEIVTDWPVFFSEYNWFHM